MSQTPKSHQLVLSKSGNLLPIWNVAFGYLQFETVSVGYYDYPITGLYDVATCRELTYTAVT